MIEILLVEDDPGDVVITREALAEHKIRNRLVVLPDGVQALAYLHCEPPFIAAQRPDLILLDLNLPGVDGRTVLDVVRGDAALAHIPVTVLTTSRAEEDILRRPGGGAPGSGSSSHRTPNEAVPAVAGRGAAARCRDRWLWRAQRARAATDHPAAPIEGAARADEVLAYGQLVCTLTGRSEIAGVLFTRDGHTVGVPRADGALGDGPLTAADYASPSPSTSPSTS